MDAATVMACVFTAAFLVLQVLDVISTNLFLRLKTGTEGNPINAWAQRVLGPSWWLVKLLDLIVVAGAWAVLPHRILGMVLGVLCVFYLVTVLQNFQLSRTP